ncbi:MAG: hypothetical protein KatS3mg077_3179 [Candidatus Binatia bacterium]|nr:MAG: hypothetical protein KatS3mg077_3179 [Candidatus Binatia bacterium]
MTWWRRSGFSLVFVGVALLAASCFSRRSLPPAPHMGPLTVAMSAEPDRGPAPLAVEFSAEVYEGDEAREPKFEWDFGDGSRRAEGARVRHEYRKPGRYTARVIVTDAYERRGEDEILIDVE